VVIWCDLYPWNSGRADPTECTTESDSPCNPITTGKKNAYNPEKLGRSNYFA